MYEQKKSNQSNEKVAKNYFGQMKFFVFYCLVLLCIVGIVANLYVNSNIESLNSASADKQCIVVDLNLDNEKNTIDENELANHELMIIGRLEKLLDILYKEEYLKKMREEFALQTKSNQFYVKQALQTLKKDDLKLLGLYYGLNGKDILTLNELSLKLGVEEEKIKSRVEMLMKKIKHYIPVGKK